MPYSAFISLHRFLTFVPFIIASLKHDNTLHCLQLTSSVVKQLEKGIRTQLRSVFTLCSNCLISLTTIYFHFCILANLSPDVVKNLPDELQTGIYFGWANVDNGEVYKAVLSLGWNPFFKNKEKSLVSANGMWFLYCDDRIRPTISISSRQLVYCQILQSLIIANIYALHV